MAKAKVKEHESEEEEHVSDSPLFTVFQGKQPLRSFAEMSLAEAYANDVRVQACKQGVDCSVEEHLVTIQ